MTKKDEKVVAETRTGALRFFRDGMKSILQEEWTVSTATEAKTEWRDVEVVSK